jgi:hypothetical protein
MPISEKELEAILEEQRKMMLDLKLSPEIAARLIKDYEKIFGPIELKDEHGRKIKT